MYLNHKHIIIVVSGVWNMEALKFAKGRGPRPTMTRGEEEPLCWIEGKGVNFICWHLLFDATGCPCFSCDKPWG